MCFDLDESITVWNIGADDGFGEVSYLGPFPYDSKTAFLAKKFTDANGDTRVSTAMTYTDGVDVAIGSLVFFGASLSPTPDAAANDVRQISQIPSEAGALKKLWFI